MGRLAQKLHSTGASRSSGAIPTWFRLRPYRFDGCRIWSRRASRANWARLFRRRGAGYWPGPIAGVVSGARRHHPALHPTPRRPCLLEPAAGRSDPTGPATRRAHRDAADRTRSAARLGRAAQTAHKLNMRTAQPCSGRSLQPGLSAVADDPAFPKVGLPQCPSEKKGRTAPARARARPVSRPCARAERRETAGLSTHRHGIHCTDKLRAGGRWIRTSDSRSRGGQTVMRDCLENRSGSVGEPKVRIHLPPAASLVRT